jgi:diguanylate cyclase (GGDEF)-like protein
MEIPGRTGAMALPPRTGWSGRQVAACYAAAAVLLLAYGISLVLRQHGQTWTWLDNWGVDSLEVALACLCLGRALVRGPGRWLALPLGLGLLGWALGDVVWTFESQGGAAPPTPSAADVFYLSLYPLAYLAVMLVMRRQPGRFQPSLWLDGAVAGLSAAAICAAFAFDTILRATHGSPAAVAVNLAYPIGDLVLLALVVAAVVIAPGLPLRLLLLATGCALLAVGDTIYLFQSAANTYVVGTPLDITWPVALLVMSASAWVRLRSVRSNDMERAPRFLVPGLAAAAGLSILVLGSMRHVSSVAIGLAAASLVAAGLRMMLSLGEIRRLVDARRHQAVTDELTGLHNRRELLHQLQLALECTDDEPGVRPVALLFIDLDQFKEINDSFGHAVGDQLLQAIGPRLAEIVRTEDTVARLGGDEFAVVLTGADGTYAEVVAGRITAALEDPFLIGGTELHIGASIGIALAPEHATGPAELMRCADVAMYRTKRAHCSFDIYEARLDAGSNHIHLMESLRKAIDERSLVLYYQPQIDLRTRAVVTLEALVRWVHPTLGPVPPDHFIPPAEEAGLIRQVTRFVLGEAATQCAEWWRQGHFVAVAVNISARDLLDLELPDEVSEVLERAGLPPSALVLEITETAVMADFDRAAAVIRRLSDSGVVVSIDDFGTGFSSLAYLSSLSVGEMKLDRMFTARLVSEVGGGRDHAIVRSAVELGHSLGLRVVAEGVEQPELVEGLLEMGCDLAQGYAIAMPQPASAIDLDALGLAVSTAVPSQQRTNTRSTRAQAPVG